MLLDIKTFRDRTEFNLDDLVADLQSETHRVGREEAAAWRNSLPTLARVLGHASLQAFHVQIGTSRGLALEYRLPASTSWADAVLLGKTDRGPAIVVIELKDWNTQGDAPGPTEGLVRHAGREVLHPSDQVRAYVEYCRRFHSVVQEESAEVHGCVFFTFASSANAYWEEPHARLARDFPVFTRSKPDLETHFPEHLAKCMTTPDGEFAQRFASGTYKQDRGFVRQIAATIADPTHTPFVLLDEQRRGFEVCLKHVNSSLRPAKTAVRKKGGKSVVIIEGPPGSGKSAIAAQLWASLASNEFVDGNVVLTTTSGSQRSNWAGLFESTSGERSARGVVIPANGYNPGLSPTWVKSQRSQGFEAPVSGWRENLARYSSQVERLRCPDDSFAVSIVDEAHALIDPTVPGKEGVPPSGWAMHAGPQAWHVIRSSKVSIFLMDGRQSYRDNETTTLESILSHAKELGVEHVEIVSLGEAQFRCAGSAEYVDWLEHTLQLGNQSAPRSEWKLGNGGLFEFELVDSPTDLERKLRVRADKGASVRLLASYARPWKTRMCPSPHSVPESERDFVFTCETDKAEGVWSKVWNYAPEQNYTFFVQAPAGSYMASDPLGEVGCPYVVRGFDFDYIGLLWLSDLVWRKDRWHVQIEHVHETAWKKSLAAARKEKSPGPKTAELIDRIKRGYRVLLTRAMHGAFVWFEDEETREHIRAHLERR